MIEIIQGDLLHADAQAFVNAVNCVGVMGRGIALQFRKAYPSNFAVYKAACDRHELRPGQVLVCALNSLTSPQFINVPTKDHWKGKSRLEYIEQGLEALVTEVKRLNLESIALPPPGCGLGGLRWDDVRPLIETAFADSWHVRVLLYAPEETP